MSRWTTEATGPRVITIRIPVTRNASWEQWALITADRHLDNPHADRAMMLRHLKQAQDRGAFNIDLGDSFCAMQGRNDKRGQKGDVGAMGVNDYFGELVRDHFRFFQPFADVLAVAGIGNHEAKVLKHNEIDLTRALVDRLRDNGSQVLRGGYSGWVRLLFSADGGSRRSLNMYYAHGSGGGGPVTKGVIQTNRRSAMLSNADIVVSGHIHEAWMMKIPKVGLSASGQEVQCDVLHLCVPTYKDEFLTSGEGFHHEKEGPPKPKGAWWLRFFFERRDNKIMVEAASAV